jgi:hypothetical protein
MGWIFHLLDGLGGAGIVAAGLADEASSAAKRPAGKMKEGAR